MSSNAPALRDALEAAEVALQNYAVYLRWLEDEGKLPLCLAALEKVQGVLNSLDSRPES